MGISECEDRLGTLRFLNCLVSKCDGDFGRFNSNINTHAYIHIYRCYTALKLVETLYGDNGENT